MKHTLRAICLVALLALSAVGQSGTRRWVKASSSEERVYFYSARDITKIAPGRVKAWMRVVERKFDADAARDVYGDDSPEYTPEETPGHFYSMELWEYDCPARKSRHLQITSFDSRGKLVEALGKPSSWQEVSPESVGEGLLEVVCRAANRPRPR